VFSKHCVVAPSPLIAVRSVTRVFAVAPRKESSLAAVSAAAAGHPSPQAAAWAAAPAPPTRSPAPSRGGDDLLRGGGGVYGQYRVYCGGGSAWAVSRSPAGEGVWGTAACGGRVSVCAVRYGLLRGGKWVGVTGNGGRVEG
jgi:hypothetical protein